MLATMFDPTRDMHITARKHWPKEAKVDGIRIDLYLKKKGRNRAFTRVAGKHTGELTEKTAHIEWLKHIDPPCDIHLTGECQWGISSRSTMSVLGSEWSRAIDMQYDVPLEFYGFDLPKIGGSPYTKRRDVLIQVVDYLCVENIHASEVLHGETDDCLREVMERGGHDGLILKDPYGFYVSNTRPPDAWIKVKPCYVFVAVVLRAVPGKGKFRGMLGSLELGMVDGNGHIIPVGSCGSGHWTVANRQEVWRPREVVEVEAYEVTEEGKLWHPRFICRRPELDWKRCSAEQLEEPTWKN
jgi:bifunctional non-homologous end joining protein LigD